MTTSKGPTDRASEEGEEEGVGSDPLLLALRRALEAPPKRKRSLLPRIQERIRQRTRGRYFKDRYSRSVDPVPLLLTVALLLLLLAAAFYLVLRPLSERPEPVELPTPPPDFIEQEREEPEPPPVPGSEHPSPGAR